MTPRLALAITLIQFGVSFGALGAPPPGPSPASAAIASPVARQYLMAQQAYADGDYPQAEKLYTNILETHGDEPMAWFRIGLIQQRRESFKAALTAYDNALACGIDPQSEELVRTLAKVRYNRALLLLQSASRDLRNIAPGVLDPDLDLTRESLSQQLDGVLHVADAEVSQPPKAASARRSSARGYVYEAKSVSVTVEPIEEATP